MWRLFVSTIIIAGITLCAALPRWPERGFTDEMDKAMSRIFFHLELPFPLEVGLSVPGSWFGCMPLALTMAPLAAALLAPKQSKLFIIISCSILVVSISWWVNGAIESAARPGDWRVGVVRAYGLLDVQQTFFAPHIILLICALGSSSGLDAASLYLSSWHVTQLCIEALKGMLWRLRPGVVLSKELEGVHRYVWQLGAVIKNPHQANLSCPSGDAAGGAAWAVALVCATRSSKCSNLASKTVQVMAAIIAVLCAIGRVYFHCHHLLDVMLGQFVAIVITIVIHFINQFVQRWTPKRVPRVFTSILLVFLGQNFQRYLWMHVGFGDKW